jgi:ferrous iron transport protein B
MNDLLATLDRATFDGEGAKTEIQKLHNQLSIQSRFSEVDRILSLSTLKSTQPALWTDRLDQIVLHPVLGTCLLISILAFVFQAIFSWAEIPKEFIESGIHGLGVQVGLWIGKGPLESLIVDGIIAGVGAVVVFLPQILILFAFILLLEDSGYMARAAFLMDRLMGKVGLHGRAFIPLLSSFACAIPGIMATRTIEQRKDRLTTILVAPLMTCSARLPIYSLLIAAFIPNIIIFGPLRLQGLVMFGLYFFGVTLALLMAVVFRKTLLRGPQPTLLMELPTYKWPRLKNIYLGLWERSVLFLRNAGTVILTVSILLWFLVSYPKPPEGFSGSAISHSYAGIVGQSLEPLFRPIGFNWKIVVALIPGLAAREVMIGSLATVYAVEGKEGGLSITLLGKSLREDWSIATALSLLVWYVLACQCFSTLAVTRRETNSFRWPIFMFLYMTSLAYLGSFSIYHLAVKMGLG